MSDSTHPFDKIRTPKGTVSYIRALCPEGHYTKRLHEGFLLAIAQHLTEAGENGPGCTVANVVAVVAHHLSRIRKMVEATPKSAYTSYVLLVFLDNLKAEERREELEILRGPLRRINSGAPVRKIIKEYIGRFK